MTLTFDHIINFRPVYAKAVSRANLVARARDPLWEESRGFGKKPKRMHGIHLNLLPMEPLQRVENDIDRKNYAPMPGY